MTTEKLSLEQLKQNATEHRRAAAAQLTILFSRAGIRVLPGEADALTEELVAAASYEAELRHRYLEEAPVLTEAAICIPEQT